tara:strand:+ start:5649 stop:6269 length:621 start_codon:yes stop_codon:yes gene_type:complete
MNLFILDEDPVIAASLNCDTHVNKIILEATQCMCAAHWEYDFPLLRFAPVKLQEGKYRGATHHNNHVTKWVRETTSNYKWTYNHAVELCRQHRYRYNKPFDHASLEIVHWLGQNIPDIPIGPQTKFRQAVAEECYHNNPVVAYWAYYAICKSHLTSWKRVETPSWYLSLTRKLIGSATASEILKYAEELYEKQKSDQITFGGLIPA